MFARTHPRSRPWIVAATALLVSGLGLRGSPSDAAGPRALRAVEVRSRQVTRVVFSRQVSNGEQILIEVTPREIVRTRLDEDGGIISLAWRALRHREFRTVTGALARHRIAQTPGAAGPGCEGEGRDVVVELRVMRGTRTSLDGRIVYCGRPPYLGSLAGDVSGFHAFLDRLLPPG